MTQKRPFSFRILFSVVALAAGALLFNSCAKDKCETSRTFTQFTPVYMSIEDFRSPDVIQSASPMGIKNPGKIYLRENLIFINEFLKGIHVIDNSDPANPVNLAFIEIPGNVDMAVLGPVLYADSHTDLLAIDISDLNNVRLLSRETDVFPQVQVINGVAVDPFQGVVVDFVEETVTETVFGDCGGNSRWNQGFGRRGGQWHSGRCPVRAADVGGRLGDRRRDDGRHLGMDDRVGGLRGR